MQRFSALFLKLVGGGGAQKGRGVLWVPKSAPAFSHNVTALTASCSLYKYRLKENNINLVEGENKIKYGNPVNLGFPISPCVMSLDWEFPSRRKWNPCFDNSSYVILKPNRK